MLLVFLIDISEVYRILISVYFIFIGQIIPSFAVRFDEVFDGEKS
jgi:hypothetical protein